MEKSTGPELGLEAEAFNTCLDSAKYRDDVLQDMRDGQQVGVTGTPAFFINGRFLNGAQPYEKFADIIEQELQNSGS